MPRVVSQASSGPDTAPTANCRNFAFSNERVVVHDERAADDVGVAAEVLGGRVHDDIRPERQRLLQRRRRERVVDHDERTRRVPGRSETGDVADVQQRIAGRLDPHDLRRALLAAPPMTAARSLMSTTRTPIAPRPQDP